MALAVLGNLLKKGIALRANTRPKKHQPKEEQLQELRHLISTARDTEFGQRYGFKDILEADKPEDPKALFEAFKTHVPIHDYNKISREWWHRCLEGEPDITWPGVVKYFALSSGTSEASTKHIPITKDMTKAIQNTSKKQILTLKYYDLPARLFETGVLMLGGSTNLNYNGVFYEGDLSGIQASRMPFWFSPFYKPGKKIAKKQDWNEKLDEIAKEAPEWDIGVIVGVPAWLQLLMEKILERYQVDHIHEIWPNLSIFTHGGVAFEPYRKSFEKLLGKPIAYMETYLASEGFVAYQDRPNKKTMKMSTNEGLFFEFIPFNEDNFDMDGQIHPEAETLMIDEVEEGADYALILSTVAGAWRYQIGDTLRFEDKSNSEIRITGRTKHFLSVVGEHLSVDNMNQGLENAAEQMGYNVKEFTVFPRPHSSMFAHHWYIGMEAAEVDKIDEEELRHHLDRELCKVNDDYETERKHALQEVYVKVIDNDIFHQWLKKHGKIGGQIKFPRVLKGEKLEDWLEFLKEKGIEE